MDFIDTNGDYLIDENLEKLKKHNDTTSKTIDIVQGADSGASKKQR